MIPNIIWQTHEQPRDQLPYPFNFNWQTWKDKNPDFSYMYTDAAQRLIDIQQYAPQLEQFYRNAHPVAQADVWRYVVTYQFGGFYADMDSICIKPLDLSILNNQFILSKIGVSFCMQCDKLIGSNYANGFFGCEAKSPVMLELLQYIEAVDKEMRNAAQFDLYHHVADYFAFSKIVSNATIPLTTVFHKYDFNCEKGNCSKASEICHGNWHKLNYHEINYEAPIDF